MDEATVTRAFDAQSGSVLADVRRFVAEKGGGVPIEFLQDLQLAVTEACANAILHSGTDEIRVSITLAGSCLEVVVEDDGTYRAKLDDAEGHRGMFLMSALVDQLSLRPGTVPGAGTVVRLVKCTP